MHASLFAVLALEDYNNPGNSSWRTDSADDMKLYIQNFTLFDPMLSSTKPYTDPIYWGLVAFYAYRTYKDETLLDLVKEAYNATYVAFITEEDAANGSGATRNTSFASPECANGSTQTSRCKSTVMSRPHLTHRNLCWRRIYCAGFFSSRLTVLLLIDSMDPP